MELVKEFVFAEIAEDGFSDVRVELTRKGCGDPANEWVCEDVLGNGYALGNRCVVIGPHSPAEAAEIAAQEFDACDRGWGRRDLMDSTVEMLTGERYIYVETPSGGECFVVRSRVNVEYSATAAPIPAGIKDLLLQKGSG